jgi:hypothetical protein
VAEPTPLSTLRRLPIGTLSSAVNTRFFAAVSTAQLFWSGLQPAAFRGPSHFLNCGSPLSAPAQEPGSTWITSPAGTGNRSR